MARRTLKISPPVEPLNPSGLFPPEGPGPTDAVLPSGVGPAVGSVVAGPSTPAGPESADAVSPSGVPGPCGPRDQVQANSLGLARDSAGLAFARLRALAECGDPKVELPAIKEILSWAWGKPAQSLNLEGDLGLADLARLLARAAGDDEGLLPRTKGQARQPRNTPEKTNTKKKPHGA